MGSREHPEKGLCSQGQARVKEDGQVEGQTLQPGSPYCCALTLSALYQTQVRAEPSALHTGDSEEMGPETGETVCGGHLLLHGRP